MQNIIILKISLWWRANDTHCGKLQQEWWNIYKKYISQIGGVMSDTNLHRIWFNTFKACHVHVHVWCTLNTHFEWAHPARGTQISSTSDVYKSTLRWRTNRAAPGYPTPTIEQQFQHLVRSTKRLLITKCSNKTQKHIIELVTHIMRYRTVSIISSEPAGELNCRAI